MAADKSSSSSEEKYRVLPNVIQNDNPDLVIAVGTAGYPLEDSINGSVVVGSNFFIHDGHPDNPKSNLKNENVGKILASNVNDKLFDVFSKDFKNATEPKFILPP